MIAMSETAVEKETPERDASITSFDGSRVHPLALEPESVSIEAIAHALSMKCRFGGHTRTFYSVAEHCVRGSRLLPSVFKLPFLLHDVSEVFLPDICAPIKPSIFYFVVNSEGIGYAPWRLLEKEHVTQILAALQLSSIEPLIYSAEVLAIDRVMRIAEQQQLMKTADGKINCDTLAPADLWETWTWKRAEAEFLGEFKRLAEK